MICGIAGCIVKFALAASKIRLVAGELEAEA